MIARAICLQPPAPGTAPEAEPLAERIVRTGETQPLLPGSSLESRASCAPGDYLPMGSCTLDTDDPGFHEGTMSRHGFHIQNNSNTWLCAWNNPTNIEIPTIATALCVKPPGSSS